MLLVVPACEERSPGNEDGAVVAPPERTASEEEINRAAGGEGWGEDGTNAAGETAGRSDPDGSADTTPTVARRVVQAAFIHRATEENSRGDYTYLADPSIDGDPNAAVFVEPTAGTGASFGRNVGVFFEPEARRWAIFAQDRTPIPEGTAFEVVVPMADESFVHRATPDNASSGGTYLDDAALNGRPKAQPSVTQNRNPGGGDGVYNDHPVGVRYDAGRGRWEVFNEDGAAMPNGASFNVTVPETAKTPAGDGDIVNVEAGGPPEYRDFFGKDKPEKPTDQGSPD